MFLTELCLYIDSSQFVPVSNKKAVDNWQYDQICTKWWYLNEARMLCNYIQDLDGLNGMEGNVTISTKCAIV